MLVERATQTAAADVGRRLYAHYDYFGYVIPTVWFLLGLALTEKTVYKSNVGAGLFAWFQATFEAPAKAPSQSPDGLSVAGQILLAVGVALIVFQLIYILGHLLNGLSALLIDRVVVKKLLKYPAHLYLLKCKHPNLTDHELSRRAVLSTSLAVTILPNLAPWLALECAAIVLQYRWRLEPAGLARDAGALGNLCALAAVAGACVLAHLGVPGCERVLRADINQEEAKGDRGRYTRLERLHAAILLVVWVAITSGLFVGNWLGWLAVPSLLNAALVVGDRVARDVNGEYRERWQEKSALYVRSTFVNWVNFVANLVDYGELPSRQVLTRAKQAVGDIPTETSDFFWLSWIRVQHGAPQLFSTSYHFLSMYGMNRNLCGATAMILLAGLTVFVLNPGVVPDTAAMASWIVGLFLLSVLFFARYLYLYAGYFTKFTIRAAACLSVVEELESRSAVVKPGYMSPTSTEDRGGSEVM